jgi:diaminohydroxyphosphoribosylaminopyrimidine deaminase/5-amino-6-(5-phosphoribosylamino)uracil reductase
MVSCDVELMRRALELAERGRGYVEPNPLVGAVVAHGDRIVGEGWHQRYGQAHAEVHALAAASDAARGATLYVTLEPCCHFGKTPPCTDAIIRAGIRRVVACMRDPFPQVAGQGMERLIAAGIEVTVGLEEACALELNGPYFKLLRTGQPYVIAKWAMSLDGKIATRTGDSRWISGETSRQRAHELRGRMDAILVGIGTVLADDPLLTARPPGPRTPVRVIFDSQLRMPLTSRLVQTARETKLIIFHSDAASSETCRLLEERGCECVGIPLQGERLNVQSVLQELGRRRLTNVLVEGGATVLGSFLDARAIDEVYVFTSPMLIGGHAAPSPFGGQGVAHIAEALVLAGPTVEVVGADWLLRGRVSRPTDAGTLPRT